MNKNFMISFKQLVVILFLIFCIIISESLKYLFIAKDIDLMNEFIKSSNYILGQKDYLLSNIISYFFIIINYVILALFSYFTRNKVKIGVIYKATYFFIIIASLLYQILLNRNIYYNYIGIILQVILLLYVLNLKKDKGGKL
ncbi:hypothetical protein [Oceanivirga salmonicida]|uniref:hypothetical protein n=1 Tax=Oceanivirga salmonicida TaxID=1769291 RepID=UPI00082E55F7|nr:hypothetical protein [Oceanivirga salmonicida]